MREPTSGALAVPTNEVRGGRLEMASGPHKVARGVLRSYGGGFALRTPAEAMGGIEVTEAGGTRWT